MRFASIAQLLGMLIRDMSIWHDDFWPLLAGVMLQSAASPFFMNSQAIVANRWFSDKERALAMGLMSAAMILGNALSFFLTGYIFSGAETVEAIKASLHRVLITQTCIIAVSFLFF